ncbi:MAG: hypothetical protein WCT25_00130 [Candidatus Paceibacterota bacterium]|jgi:hypothetical protein
MAPNDKLNPPAKLKAVILSEIGKEERRRAKFFLFSASGGLLLSLSGLVWSLGYLSQAVEQSGFYSYLSLLFSDIDLVLSSERELAFSLIESAPVSEITVSLTLVATLLLSLRILVANWQNGFRHSFSS